jgi:hypothetical protein
MIEVDAYVVDTLMVDLVVPGGADLQRKTITRRERRKRVRMRMKASSASSLRSSASA